MRSAEQIVGGSEIATPRRKVRIAFLIRALDTGGAGRQLLELVKSLDKERYTVTVITYYDGGDFDKEVETIAGTRLIRLNKKGRWDVVPFLLRLWAALRGSEAAIVHGYMSVSNELAWLFGRFLGAKVVWGLRASDLDFSQYNWLTALAFRCGTCLSRGADLIIANSHVGRLRHQEAGYARQRMIVISNGIDVNYFRPHAAAGQRVRSDWGVSTDERLVGLVARLDPMKDHPTFLRAAALLTGKLGQVRFVCVGPGPEKYHDRLRQLSQELGIASRVIWRPYQKDMPAIYSALDLLVSSSSFGEGFSNALAEGMACGVPCVATDVGDSALVIGNAEQVVAPRDPAALMTACLRILSMPDQDRGRLGAKARERIVEHFSVERLAAETDKALSRLVSAGPESA